jgi:hypothetical protein
MSALDDAKDYRFVDLPGYMDWSRRVLATGESEALIAHLDATSARLTPSELSAITDAFFDEMLADLKTALEKYE